MENIDKWRRLSTWATPGPWEPIDEYDNSNILPNNFGWRAISCNRNYGGRGGKALLFATHEWDVGLKSNDIEFICAAREAVPALIAEVDRLTEELKKVKRFEFVDPESLSNVSEDDLYVVIAKGEVVVGGYCPELYEWSVLGNGAEIEPEWVLLLPPLPKEQL